MTVAEFAGCTLLAFGTPFSMFLFTIMHDPIRIIIMIATAFVWLVALIASSLIWYCLSPLSPPTIVGVVVSVLMQVILHHVPNTSRINLYILYFVAQEVFRYGVYVLLRKTDNFLSEVTDDTTVIDNKHILAYVSGFGFGIMGGAFALVNVLADAIGPATMGLLGGSDIFFVTSAAQTLCMILLQPCWAVIFFDACDTRDQRRIGFVLIGHLAVSTLTLLNRWELYAVTLPLSYALLLVSACVALKTAGGSLESVKRFVKCQ